MDVNQNKRNALLDIIKGIAIFSVVVGHVIQCGTVSIDFFGNKLFIFIYSFHMPLFMLVSGYLFFSSISKHSTKEIFLNRILKLLYIIIIWGSISYVVHLVQGTKAIGNTIGDTLFSYIVYLLNYLWFLWAIIFATLTILFAEKVIKNSIIKIVFLVIINFGIMFMPDFYEIAAVCKWMMLYFILAFYFAKHQSKFKLDKKKNLIIFIVSSIMFVGLLFFYNYSAYIYTSGFSILVKGRMFKQIIIDCYRSAIGLIGSVSIIYIAYYLKKYLTFFEPFGKNSLEIYVISNMIFNQWLMIYTRAIPFNYLFVLVESLGIITFCFILSHLSNKNKIVKGIFWGVKIKLKKNITITTNSNE